MPEYVTISSWNDCQRNIGAFQRLFGNQNFKTLVNIYHDYPNVFKTFASYISSGTVISSAL